MRHAARGVAAAAGLKLALKLVAEVAQAERRAAVHGQRAAACVAEGAVGVWSGRRRGAGPGNENAGIWGG